MDKGYFKEEGLEDVELIVFPDDEVAQLEALANGFLDIAIDPLIHKVLAAQDKGDLRSEMDEIHRGSERSYPARWQ
jgi:ABC-type nitrate/sulfonate/bicarbonate transport system substrate-binding protein